jgi:large subunit ribosomal protein L24
MKLFSTAWKSSTKARKQRKYRFTLPTHTRQRLIRSHLSKELKKKYNRRSIGIRVGDKMRILRGQFKKKEGKIEHIDRKRERVYISGIEILKKDGSKSQFPIHPSNLIVVEAQINDKRRKQKLEGNKK